MSSNIPWESIPSATEDNKRAADMLIRLDDGQERRTGYDGGWLYFEDATHTSSNKQSIAAGARVHVTIDGLGTGTNINFRRGIGTDVLGNSTIQPFATGETYNINLTFQASKSSSTATFVEVDVGIGSDYGTTISRDRRAMTKGSDIEDYFFFNGTLFATPAFNQYGARFFFNFSEDVSVWNKAIFLQRTHSP